jgi:hypothetical protein
MQKKPQEKNMTEHHVSLVVSSRGPLLHVKTLTFSLRAVGNKWFTSKEESQGQVDTPVLEERKIVETGFGSPVWALRESRGGGCPSRRPHRLDQD